MLRQRTRTLQGAVALTDAVATTCAFFAAYYLAGPLLQRIADVKVVLPVGRYYWVLLVSVPMWWALFAVFGGYDFSPIERIRDSLLRLWRPLLVGVMALAALTFFRKDPNFSRRVVAAISLCNVFFILAGRALVLDTAARIHRKAGGLRRVVVVGGDAAADAIGKTIRRAGWGLELVGRIAHDAVPGGERHGTLGALEDLPRLLDEHSIDGVVIAEARELAAVRKIIADCEEVGVSIHIPHYLFKAELSRPHLEPFFNIPMLTFSTTPYSPIALGIKRGADIVFGLGLLIAAALPMFIIAILIKATSRGPIIFKQRRVGLYGRPFTMYKFRSMVADAEQRLSDVRELNEADGPAFKITSDPRVTPLGRWLRRYSLDELPQLWNVLKGDMSLVGPRPPLPSEVESYRRWQRRRLSMRPGLTCLWQVSPLRHASFDKWMEYDLKYIDSWSLWLDVKIILRTIPAVLRGTGV